jgi:hypothetical protein
MSKLQSSTLVECVDGSGTQESTHAYGTGLHSRGGTSSAARRSTRGSSTSSGLLVDRSGGSGLARSEGKFGNSGSARESTLTLFVRGVSDGGIARIENLVDDMNDTVGNEDISDGDASAVDEDATLLADGDGEIVTVQGSKDGSVLETRGVANSAVDNVVGQDVSNVLNGGIGKSRANITESLSSGSKDGNVWCSVHSIEQVGRVQGTAKAGQVGRCQSIRNVRGQDEESVNNVDHTASEVDVLSIVRHDC